MTDQAPDKIHIDDLPEEARAIADIIGMDALMALSEKLGGERIYIPLPDRLGIEARNRAMRAEFNGRNYRELAIKYNLTIRWVRIIISGKPVSASRADDDEGRDRFKQLKLC